MTWNTDLFFKTTYVSVFLRFRSIICCICSKKNRIIKTCIVNFISMTWNTDLFFKTTYVSVFLRFRSIICCFQCFVCGSSPFGKVVCHETPPTPRKLLPLNPLSPSVFPMVFTGGYGYFLDFTFRGSSVVKGIIFMIKAYPV